MATTPAQITGMNVRAEMARQGVSQMQISAVIGVSQTGVSSRLRGETPFDVNELQAVAEHLSVAASTLLPGQLVAT